MNNKHHYKWISKCGRYTVFLSKECYEKIIKFSINTLPNEIGSSMIGYYSDDGFEAYIEGLAPISKDSVSKRSSFLRGTQGLKEYYEKLSSSIIQKYYYVGEWHSHPFNAPIPSAIDDKNQFDISNDQKTKCPESILIIIGNDIANRPLYNIFVYSRKKGKINLSLIDY